MACGNCGNSADCKNCGGTIAKERCPDPCIQPIAQCAGVEWICGDWKYTEVNGCTTRVRVSNNVPDGVYINPTITIKDGCIVAITNGSNTVIARPEPCALLTT
jgi:hypothetical protein